MSEVKEAAIKSVLLAAPPGQFDIILEDLRSMQSSAASLLAGGAQFVDEVRSEWEASTGRSTLSTAADGDEGDCTITASLSKAMDKYLALKFSSPGVRAARTVTKSDGGDAADGPTYKIVTFAERIDLHNHHAGSWNGCYYVRPSSGEVSGTVSIRAHTFENGGNVQLHSNVTLGKVNVSRCSGDEDDEKLSSWAKAVTRQIERWENDEVNHNLDGMYMSMGNTYLKSLRRVMPVTRTKMEWNVNSHIMLQTLGQGHTKDKFKH